MYGSHAYAVENRRHSGRGKITIVVELEVEIWVLAQQKSNAFFAVVPLKRVRSDQYDDILRCAKAILSSCSVDYIWFIGGLNTYWHAIKSDDDPVFFRIFTFAPWSRQSFKH